MMQCTTNSLFFDFIFGLFFRFTVALWLVFPASTRSTIAIRFFFLRRKKINKSINSANHVVNFKFSAAVTKDRTNFVDSS